MAHRASAARARRALAGALLLGLGGCGASDDAYVVGNARWNDIDVAVESRPAPPRAGNNEVVVVLTGTRHQPVYDALVSVRAQAGAPWVQAIEDGHVGVYRRAVNFGAGSQATIEVQLQRGEARDTLTFPVAMLSAR
jgi:hypothetical protein